MARVTDEIQEDRHVRKLAFLAVVAVIIIKHRRRPVPHVSVFDLVGNEQARLILLLSAPRPPEPFAKTMQHFRRVARVTEMMFLAGNKPKITIDQP